MEDKVQERDRCIDYLTTKSKEIEDARDKYKGDAERRERRLKQGEETRKKLRGEIEERQKKMKKLNSHNDQLKKEIEGIRPKYERLMKDITELLVNNFHKLFFRK